MANSTRQDLTAYCLRQLGGGVINIEVTTDQLGDCIESALQFYTEYHYDGIEKDYFSRKVTGTTLSLTDSTGFSVGDTISCVEKDIHSQILSISGNDVTISKSILVANQIWKTGDIVQNQNSVSTQLTSVSIGDIDNGFIPIDSKIVGVNKVLNISNVLSSRETLYNFNYQIMLSEVQNITSAGSSYLYGVMNYLDNLAFVMRKEKDFRFNRRWGKVYLDIDWYNDVAIGDYIVLDVYRALDDTVYTDILNDRWLKKYTTALIKRQWGTNVKKYSGVKLPGGVTYNGQLIFDEATIEIDNLEKEALESGAPLGFHVG